MTRGTSLRGQTSDLGIIDEAWAFDEPRPMSLTLWVCLTWQYAAACNATIRFAIRDALGESC